MSGSGKSLKEKVYRELREFLIIALYLWVIFALLIQYKSVVLAEYHIQFAYQGIALVNALALAKVMLILKGVRLGDPHNHAPLIYQIVVKAALYTTILACFKILEEYVIGLIHHRSFHESMETIGGGTGKGMLVLMVLLFVILIPFVAFSELRDAVGSERMAAFLFHRQLSQEGHRAV